MPGPKSHRVVTLSDADRDQLLDLARSGGSPAALARRADIVLRAAGGERIRAIARAVGVRRDVVRKWLDRWRDQGLEGLDDLPRPGRPRGADPDFEDVTIRTDDFPLPEPKSFDWSRLPPARRAEIERALALLGLIATRKPASPALATA